MKYPIPVVRIILKNDDGKILFLKRAATKYDDGKWCLPGGKIEAGQTAEEACRREAKEETGLSINNLKFLFNSNITKTLGKNFLTSYFLTDFFGEIRINEESSDYNWFSFEELSNIDIAFNQKEAIERFSRI